MKINPTTILKNHDLILHHSICIVLGSVLLERESHLSKRQISLGAFPSNIIELICCLTRETHGEFGQRLNANNIVMHNKAALSSQGQRPSMLHEVPVTLFAPKRVSADGHIESRRKVLLRMALFTHLNIVH